MRRGLLLIVLLNVWCSSFPQSIKEKLSFAIKVLEADSQCRHGIISLYVTDSKTGAVIFNKNGETGLAPASCQKIVTSVAALELLGKEYSYKTSLAYNGKIENGLLDGNIYIASNGDPTFGSWRYAKTKENVILDEIKHAVKNEGIKHITGKIITDNKSWETQTIPAGWIWEDIGNYYGAGVSALNWRENQYDLILRSGNKIGDSVKIISADPPFVQGLNLVNELTSAAPQSGDNTVIYVAPDSKIGYVRGTIPVKQDHFIISGSMPDVALQFSAALCNIMDWDSSYLKNNIPHKSDLKPLKVFYTYTSPSLDSINYWFLKKSINLYGEALVKTIAYEKSGHGSTDTGVNIIKDFWSKRGIEKTALNIIDGSGLSPANRITTSSLTAILQYAQKQAWFSSFYNALPEINNIKMKSGSIGGVLSYTGYLESRSGGEYTFAFIINNFNGSSSALRGKMWKLLDILK